MTRGTRYCLKTATVAVAPEEAEGHKVAITIPAGGIVEVLRTCADGERLLMVQWEGKLCEMFTEDLRERGEVVGVTSAGGRPSF